MAIDTWFPLAIYYEDLPDSAAQNAKLVDRINDLRHASGDQFTSEDSSWTGDVHNVDRLHHDPAFNWLTQQIAQHALLYLGHLGHDLEKIDVFVQRAWPIIAGKGQSISRHAHHTAHLSAVYYVHAPDQENCGSLRFINASTPNELSQGLGSNHTHAYIGSNPLNYGSSVYDPVPGRLLLFPAKQLHEVAANVSEHPRISISFDLMITSRGGREDGHHEFLMPSPRLWGRIIESGAISGDFLANQDDAQLERRPLGPATDLHDPIDTFSLADQADHVCWQPQSFSNCSSPAAWSEYAEAVKQTGPDQWQQMAATLRCLTPCPPGWSINQDAVDRLYTELRRRQIPLAGATLGPPRLLHLSGHPGTDRQREQAHLSVYIRVDHEPSASAILEISGEQAIDLAPGTMVIASGFRQQRIRGSGYIVHFLVDLPALARTDALRLEIVRNAELTDLTIFHMATAQPLHAPMPSMAQLRAKQSWLEGYNAISQRQRSCPVIRHYLYEGKDPGTATQSDLDLIRSYAASNDPAHDSANSDEGRIVEKQHVLSPSECRTLFTYASRHMTANVADTVDDYPEYQVNLAPETLAQLIGAQRTEQLLELPGLLDETSSTQVEYKTGTVTIFLRAYSADTRPYIPFHSDISSCTVNIALNDDGDFSGGHLLILNDNRLRTVERRAGSVLVHQGNLVHGVTRMEEGQRYSLIMFFDAVT